MTRFVALTVAALISSAFSASAQIPRRVYEPDGAVPLAADTQAQPPVVIHSLQSPQGSVANVDFLEVDVYRNPDREPWTISVFMNLNATTGALFPGAMIADNMGLGAGYNPGDDDLTSYDALFFRSSSDPQPGLADFHMALWDGDPFCMYDTPGNGFACAPIPGTEADIVGVPANTVFTARHVMPKGIKAPNQRVWMVVSGSQTGINPSPCRLGWDIAYGPAIIGDNQITGDPRDDDFFLTQEDENNGADGPSGQGTCCADGGSCNASALCASDPTGARGHCWDDVAENPSQNIIASGAGTRCDMYAGSGCANLTAGIRSEAYSSIQLMPAGNDAAGNLDPGASIDGNHITLANGGTTVFIEIRIGDWDSFDVGRPLRGWYVTLDSSGLYRGLEEIVTPHQSPCANDADCRAALGGFCRISRTACIQDGDCPLAPLEARDGPSCDVQSSTPGLCPAGFIQQGHPDYVFRDKGSTDLAGVGVLSGDYVFASVVSQGSGVQAPDPFPDQALYAGTLVLHVPVEAKGTFAVGMKPQPHTYCRDHHGDILPRLALIPATITVQTGRCCVDLQGDPYCWDNVTRPQCEDAPGHSLFTPNLTCDDPCVECTQDLDCDDGLWCNGAEFCDVLRQCQPGTPSCIDGIACTEDACDETFNQCAYVAISAMCDDGLFCNGLEQCDLAAGCVQGTPPCTEDLCHEELEACDPQPIPTVSFWGLLVLALSMLIGSRRVFVQPLRRGD